MIASKQNRIDLSFFVGSVVGRCHGLMGWGGGTVAHFSYFPYPLLRIHPWRNEVGVD